VTAPPKTVTAEQLEAFIASRMGDVAAQQRHTVLSALAVEALAWIAVSNDVPPALARILGLRQGEPPLAPMLTLGILEARTSGRGEPSYSVASRQELIRELLDRQRTMSVHSALLPTARQVLRSSERFGADVLRLAKLVGEAGSTEHMADLFEQRIREASARHDSASALEWTATGRALTPLLTAYLQPELGYAVERAGRNIELLQRRRDDLQHLRGFVERQEQIEAIDRLVRGPDDAWALHLLGAGGVGKTMLVRWLTVNAQERYDAAVARVDFDYLNPDYPRRHPGLLLWALAQELRVYDMRGEATELFDKAAKLLNDVQRNATERRDARATDDPQFVMAVRIWNQALNALPQSKIVLILDTCEELAKIRQDGVMPASVEETFRILAAVHDGPDTLTDGSPEGGVPRVRVVFAGRRPLAQKGSGWSCPASPLPPRDFLLLQELRGFTALEARGYLEQLGVARDLIEPILQHAPEVPRTADVILSGATPVRRESRYNPYLLTYFGRFAAEEPEAARAIPAGSWEQRYIELRVLQRIRFEPLTKALPTIAAARHVDAAYLRAVTGLNAADVDLLLEELSDSEWTDVRYVAAREGSEARRVISIKKGIQRDLIAYYADRPSAETRANERGAEHLRRLTLEADLSDLDWTYFDAALWMLGRREESLAWWAEVEERAIRDRGYAWLFELTSNLLGEDAAAAPAERPQDELPLRAAVLASHAVALMHLRREGVAGFWADVLASLRGRRGAAWDALARRAKLGVLANRTFAEVAQIEELYRELWEELEVEVEAVRGTLDVQRAAAIVAACENIIEHFEELEDPEDITTAILHVLTREQGLNVLAASLAEVAEKSRESIALRAFTECLLGRAENLLGNHRLAERHFTDAVRRANVGSVEFRDWVAPEDLPSRVALELIRGMYPNLAEARNVLAAAGPAPRAAATEDSERFLSAWFMLRAATDPVDPGEVLEVLGWNLDHVEIRDEKEFGTFRGQCAAHRATRPLFVTAASILAGAGRLDEAVAILTFARDATSVEPSSIRAADRLLLDLAFRFRLHEEGIGLASSAISASRDAEDKARLWSLQAWTGRPEVLDKVRLENDPREAHAVWMATPALSEADRSKALLWMWSAESRPATATLEMHLRLDEEELRLLQANGGRARVLLEAPNDRADALRVALRARALDVPGVAVGDLAKWVGARTAAYMALDEGAHLLLRLPSRAAILFRQSRDWFKQCGDTVGVFFATVNDTLARVIAAEQTDIVPAMDAYGNLRPEMEWPDIRDLMVERFGRDTVRAAALEDIPKAWRPMLARFVLANLTRHTGAVLEMKVQAREFFAKRTPKLSIDVKGVLEAAAPKEEPRKTGSIPFVAVATAILLALVLRLSWGQPWSTAMQSKIAGLGISTSLGVIAPLVLLIGLLAWKKTREATMGCGCLITSLGTLFFGFRSVTNRWIGDFGFGWQFGIFIVAGGALIAASVVGVRKWKAMLARATEITLTLSSSADVRARRGSGSEPVKLLLRVRKPRFRLPRAQVWWPLIVPRGGKSQETEYIVSSAGFASYRDLAASAPDALVKKLQELVEPIPKGESFLAGLVTPPEVCGPAWEAIAAARVDDGSPADARLRFRRTVPGRVAMAEGPWKSRIGVAGWGATPFCERVLEEAWNGPHTRVEIIGGASISAASAIPEGMLILHLMAVFDERSSGVGIRGAAIGTEDVRIDRAETVRRRVPTAELCIVQGDLLRVRRRSEADRQDAMLARRFAAELALAGFPAVLVLPRLTSESAIEVIRELPSILGRVQEVNDRMLMDAVRAIQKRIAAGDSPDDIGWETACDVTLYADESWTRHIER
jgi:hypothetical protein